MTSLLANFYQQIQMATSLCPLNCCPPSLADFRPQLLAFELNRVNAAGWSVTRRMSHGWSEGRKKLLADGAVSGTVTDAPVVLGRSVPGLGGGIVAARTCAAPDHLGVFKFVMSL